jgi:mannose-6-phosphate isomerase-like protein (cupin superfamily)
MESVNIEEISNFKSSKAVKTIPIISKQLMSTVFFIDAKTTTPTHKHQWFDEIYYIIEGKGKITVDSESKIIKKGMLILVPKTKQHNFSTDGERLTVLSINIVSDGNKNNY